MPKADIEPALAAKAGSCVEASSKTLYAYVLKEKYEDPGKLLRYYVFSTSLYGGGVWLLLDMPQVPIAESSHDYYLLSQHQGRDGRLFHIRRLCVNLRLSSYIFLCSFLQRRWCADIPLGTAHRLLDAIKHLLQWGARGFWRSGGPD